MRLSAAGGSRRGARPRGNEQGRPDPGERASVSRSPRQDLLRRFHHAERDFLFANDPWFVGVALTYGPDGAVYMIDWYDAQHCHHSQVEKWDRSNGRVYRVAYGNAAPRSVDLNALPDARLIELQEFRRTLDDYLMQCNRTLAEKPDAACPVVEDLRGVAR